MSTRLTTTCISTAFRLAKLLHCEDFDTLERAYDILLSLLQKAGDEECQSVAEMCRQIENRDVDALTGRAPLQLIEGGAQ